METHRENIFEEQPDATQQTPSTTLRCMLSRRALLRLAVAGGAGMVGTGVLTSAFCSVSHTLKLQHIKRECNDAMEAYLRRKQSGASDLMSAEQWLHSTTKILDERFVARSWKSGGVRSQGSFDYLLGDFNFDRIEMPSQNDPRIQTKEEKWLGRCGCVARYAALEAAGNGFADVRIYFASHPRRYTSVCPLTMHYYAVVGKNDVEEPDSRFFLLMTHKSGMYQFVALNESEIDAYLAKDYDDGTIHLCIHSERPVIPAKHSGLV
jgi:hypothetical protein